METQRLKYADDDSIRDKILALFLDRKITDLLALSGLNTNKVFIGQLIDIQHRIYLLDAYLESEWELDIQKIKEYRQGIVTALLALHNSEKLVRKLIREIRQYERIERNCRKNVWPTSVPFYDFYTTKSCDVRLIRRLVYTAHPALHKMWTEDSWQAYDRITEVHDDIADVPEDLLTFNGNRFLISTLRKGPVKTAKQYRSFLLQTTGQGLKYLTRQKKTPEYALLKEWMLTRSSETLQLLESFPRKNDLASFESAILLKYMQ